MEKNLVYKVAVSIMMYKIFEQCNNIVGELIEIIFLKNGNEILLYLLLIISIIILFAFSVVLLRKLLIIWKQTPLYFTLTVLGYISLIVLQIPINTYLATLESGSTGLFAKSYSAQITIWTLFNYFIMVSALIAFFMFRGSLFQTVSEKRDL